MKKNLQRINTVYKYYNDMPSINEYVNNILKTTNKNCLNKLFTNFFEMQFGMECLKEPKAF